jgi:hypothetical protein
MYVYYGMRGDFTWYDFERYSDCNGCEYRCMMVDPMHA